MRTSWIVMGTLAMTMMMTGCDGLGAGGDEITPRAEDESALWMPTATEAGLLDFVNDQSFTTFELLDDDCAIRSDSARNIIEHRDGQDKDPYTADDDLFDTAAELEDIHMVGPWTMDRLVDCAEYRGYIESDGCEALSYEGDLDSFPSTYIGIEEGLEGEFAVVAAALKLDAEQYADPTAPYPIRFGDAFIYWDGIDAVGYQVSFNQMIDPEGGIQLWMYFTLDSCFEVVDVWAGI